LTAGIAADRRTADEPPPSSRAAARERNVRSATNGLLGVLVLSRSIGLRRSLWHDEAYTAWAYVERGPATIHAAEAYIPNNHLLFSYLAWLSSRGLGTSEVSLRLWSLIPGLAASVVLVRWVGRRLGWHVAFVTAGFMLVSPLHLALVTEARGYGLVLAASVGLLIGAVGASERDRGRDDATWFSSALVGCLTIPSFVVPVVATAGLLAGTPARRRWRRWTLLGGGAAVIVALWYQPLVQAILGRVDAVGSGWGVRAGPSAILWAPPALLGAPSVTHLLPGAPARMVEGAAVALVALGGWWLWRRDRPLAVIVILLPVLSLAFLAVLRFHLLARYVAYLYPAVAVASAAGLVAGVSWLAKRSRPATMVLVPLSVALLVVGGWRAVTASVTVPRQDFRSVAGLVAEVAPDEVVLASPHVGFTYYLTAHELLVIEDEVVLDQHLCRAEPPVLYLPPVDRPAPLLPCLEQRGYVRYGWAQRSEPGTMTAWVLR
jgi:hypothetical protein